MAKVRIGLANAVMDVADYDLNKHIYVGEDDVIYDIDSIEYFILTKDEFVKLHPLKQDKVKIDK
jgi:hypothetical protein